MLTCLCHAIYMKQRHLGAGVSHYRRCDNVTGLGHRFGMCHGVCASDVTGLACVVASVHQISWRLCVRCHRFGMCHGVCASDVMASVRQMSCHVMLKLPLIICQKPSKTAARFINTPHYTIRYATYANMMKAIRLFII